MSKNNRSLLLAAIAVLFMASCAKEGPTGPTGNAGPSYTGTVGGHVTFYDKYGSQEIKAYNTVSLQLNGGIAYNPIVIPDSTTGLYSYPNIVTDNYIISATSDSPFAATQMNFLFFSGYQNLDIRMSAIPDSFLTSFAAYQGIGSLSDSLVVTATPDARLRKCIIFLNSGGVNNQVSNYLLKYIVPIPANTTTVTQLVPQQDLLNMGLASGTTVHYAAYSYVVGDASVYEDTVTGRNVYNAVNATPLLGTAIVP